MCSSYRSRASQAFQPPKVFATDRAYPAFGTYGERVNAIADKARARVQSQLSAARTRIEEEVRKENEAFMAWRNTLLSQKCLSRLTLVEFTAVGSWIDTLKDKVRLMELDEPVEWTILSALRDTQDTASVPRQLPRRTHVPSTLKKRVQGLLKLHVQRRSQLVDEAHYVLWEWEKETLDGAELWRKAMLDLTQAPRANAIDLDLQNLWNTVSRLKALVPFHWPAGDLDQFSIPATDTGRATHDASAAFGRRHSSGYQQPSLQSQRHAHQYALSFEQARPLPFSAPPNSQAWTDSHAHTPYLPGAAGYGISYMSPYADHSGYPPDSAHLARTPAPTYSSTEPWSPPSWNDIPPDVHDQLQQQYSASGSGLGGLAYGGGPGSPSEQRAPPPSSAYPRVFRTSPPSNPYYPPHHPFQYYPPPQ
ncbi:hypothetical protein JCM10908_006635 [Rhodotorula pacifica]|uniref:uncharacterized protein n=1 Tax=Rhodotorula pacifica TaxID=1495444 RepID=UPI0031771334